MARRVNQSPSESIEEMGDKAAELGGSPGMVAEFSEPGKPLINVFREEPPNAHKIKQYVVINAGGHGMFNRPIGDYFQAFALP